MHPIWWATGLFVIGVVEFIIDQVQKIHLSRLNLWKTTIYQLLNKYFEFIVNVYAFGAIVDFWTQARAGHYHFSTLGPYLAYLHGCVAGTAIALVIYVRQKRKKDREKAIRLMEKPRKKSKKKQTKKQKKVEEVIQAATSETLLDSVEVEDIKSEVKERAIEKASQKISDKIDEAFDIGESK
jgi:hypothetical protein